MKRLAILSFFFLSICTAFAQNAVSFRMTNGQTYQRAIADIDSIFIADDATYLRIAHGIMVDVLPIEGIVEFYPDELQSVVSITYNGTEASVVNPFYFDGLTITTEGAHVYVSNVNDTEYEYQLSGTSSDGCFKIYSTKKFQVTLKGLDLTNQSGPAINSQSKKRFELKAQKGYVNTLTDGTTYADTVNDEDQKGCVFSEGQIVIKGAGELNVNAKHSNGIASDDYIEIENATTNIATTANAAKAIKANEYVAMSGGVVNITQSGTYTKEGTDYSYVTGLKADEEISITGGSLTINTSATAGRGIATDSIANIKGGTINIKATGTGGKGFKVDGDCNFGETATEGPDITVATTGSYSNTYGKPKAIRVEGALTINSGNYTITTTQNEGEGIESKTSINLNGGNIYVKAYDDGINCAGPIVFNGAYVYCWSTGNDAIDSNYNRTGAIQINDGVALAISTKGDPEEAWDCDNNSNITINGGTAIGIGGQQGGGGGGGGGHGGGPGGGPGGGQGGSSSSVGSSTQGYSLYSTTLSYSTGKYYTLQDADGNAIVTYSVPQAATSKLSLFTAPAMVSGQTYYVKYNTTAPTDATATVGTLYIGSQTAGSTDFTSFTAK